MYSSIDRPLRSLIVVAAVLVVTLPGLARLGVDADISRLVPAHSEAAGGLALMLEGFASRSTIYGLLELEQGSDPEGLLEQGAELRSSLEELAWVESVRFGPGESLDVDPLAVLDVAEGATLAALEERVAPAALRQRARTLKQLLTGPGSAELRALLLADPLGLLPVLGEHLVGASGRVGAGGEGFVSPDGSALLLLVETSELPGSERADALAELQGRAEEGLPEGLRFRSTGSWAHASAIARATRKDASLLSTVSIVAILLLYLGFYRSLPSLGLVFGLLPVAALATVGLAGWIFGELSPLSVGALVIVFGLGIDPAIHLISRYREALCELDPPAAARLALKGVGPAVIVAALTSSAALLAMAWTDPGALGQLGILAALGVLINAALMLTALPALWMLLGDRLGPDPGIGVGAARRYAAGLRQRGPLLLGIVALCVVGCVAWGWPRLHFEVDLDAFQPASLEPVQVDRALRAHFQEDADPLVLLLRGEDEERVLEANDRWAPGLVELGAESLSSVRPSRATAAENRSTALQRLDLAAAAESFRQALQSEGFRVEPFEPALQRLEAPPQAIPSPPWIAWFEEQHLARTAGGTLVLTRIPPGEEPGATASQVRAGAPEPLEGVEAFITGRSLVEAEGAQGIRSTLPRLLCIALVALTLVLLLRYRRPRVALLAAVPLALSVLVFVGLHGALGLAITPFSLGALPLLIGVGIDDHLFVLDRYLEGGRPGSLGDTLAGAGRAVGVTTLTTVAAFGLLSFSSFDPLASFGLAVVMALGLAFCSSVVVMPVLLALWLPGEEGTC